MPNIPEAIVAFLATASIGAVWSSCSPDFGPASVDRPLRPDRAEGPLRRRRLPLRRQGLRPPRGRRRAAGGDAEPASAPSSSPTSTPTPTSAALARRDAAGTSCSPPARAPSSRFERVPFDHPLWVLYSSGTTGLPKAIVQGQGGILLEHLKKLHLHVDAHPGDRLFWFTTTGWMMWNFLVSGLLTRAAIVLYDGNPGHPDMGVLWDLAERAGVTMFGTSAAYIAACMKAGVEPGAGRDLSRLQGGRLDRLPALPRGLRLDLRARSAPTPGCSRPAAAPTSAPPSSAASPLLPVYRGELQARALGAAVEAWDEDGKLGDRRGRRAGRHRADALDAGLLLGRRGRQPLPRQLLRACTPASGATATGSRSPRAARRSSTAAPTRRSTAAASAWGRARSTARCSASTRSSTRSSSTSRGPGTDGWMPLFVVLREGAELDDELRGRDRPPDPRAAARRATSPTRSSRSPRCRARSAARCSRCR